MSKYYTPTIEEFHVGFEFEVNYGKGKWIKESLHAAPQVVTLPYMKLESIRVKYLDKEDIESLGFEGQAANTVYFKRDGYRLVLWPHGFITSIYRVYSPSEEEKIFDGIVKNKSELKKLLRQLKIIE